MMAVRHGPWKAHFMTQASYGQPQPEKHDPPILYHLERDPSERWNVAEKHPEVAKELAELWESEARRTMIYPLPGGRKK